MRLTIAVIATGTVLANAAAAENPASPSLSLDPTAPQTGGLLPSTVPPPTSGAASGDASAPTPGGWKFRVSGYFRAPMRMSWGPATTDDPQGASVDNGTQLRTPPLVPDANYIDWRYTNSFIGPWTELNFHYGNERTQATVQIASYNLTDAGYRRLEANLGINQAFLTMNFPEVITDDGRIIVTAGAFTNRYGAAGRYDAGKYETYLFGRTHTAGETVRLEYDLGRWTLVAEHGFGAKLEPTPFYPTTSSTSNQPWDPYPGPAPHESTFVHHAHVGAIWRGKLLLGAHFIDTFANDNERAGAYVAQRYGGTAVLSRHEGIRPRIRVWGADAKLLGGVSGDGYLGYAHLDALNAETLADAIEVLHSYGGWQLHDNFFGVPGAVEHATGKIDSVEFQWVLSIGQLLRYPQAFWGDGPDLIVSLFGMYNHVSGAVNPAFNHGKVKGGGELAYLPVAWFGVGGRFDAVEPNLNDNTQSFYVLSPRLYVRTAFVTHEQIIVQYARYFYGANAAHGQYPYNQQAGGADLGADKNAFQIAAVIYF